MSYLEIEFYVSITVFANKSILMIIEWSLVIGPQRFFIPTAMIPISWIMLIMLTHWGRDEMNNISQTTFKRIFFNENVLISIKISLKFVPNGPIDNIPALVEIMAWRRSGDKPLTEPMMVSLPTHICVTRPQWVNSTLGNVCNQDVRLLFDTILISPTPVVSVLQLLTLKQFLLPAIPLRWISRYHNCINT